jgi:protein-arginine kinase
LTEHCVRCGLTKNAFLAFGKFGCPSCHEIFLPGKLVRVTQNSKDRLVDLQNIKALPAISWKEISFRLRIARCLRQGFFPYYARSEDVIRNLLTKNGLQLTESGLETKPAAGNGRYYLGEEDHLRWEWISAKAPNSPPLRIQVLPFSRFLYERGLWAWDPQVGFINSCPTNCGRGDRLSVQARTTRESVLAISSSITNYLSFGLDFSSMADVQRENGAESQSVLVQISCKNGNPVQKLRFFKILGLLGLV